MRRPPDRGFHLLDAMTLVAATAVGIAGGWADFRDRWMNFLLPTSYWDWFAEERRHWPTLACTRVVTDGIELLCPCLAAWTIAWLVLRFRRPRAPRRRLLLQPGAVACAAATCALGLSALGGLSFRPVLFYLRGYPFSIGMDRVFDALRLAYSQVDRIAFAVLASWACLSLARRFRPRPDWIDRGGCVLGCAWIIAALSEWWSSIASNVMHPSDIGP
jgi:hypothetical protein